MGWRENRLKRLGNRAAYAKEVSEFFAEVLMDPQCPPDVADRCRKRLDELEDEGKYLEGALLRLQRHP